MMEAKLTGYGLKAYPLSTYWITNQDIEGKIFCLNWDASSQRIWVEWRENDVSMWEKCVWRADECRYIHALANLMSY